ncbi:hypothetical protein [Phenylobacterium sp.]|uniref:hypothetical protein n=1 Tax=Phenylobacterium sp. TaxID=1871053 RepID=UPI002CB211E2|nr:hypothetical protein [Phenylobacterium sp.]HVI31612.1 hypothetical protein [Phenylobacterium sp.]
MILGEHELLFGSVPYENRLCVYFDILGWRSHIEEAGSDPRRIARLRAALANFSAFAQPSGSQGHAGRISTFSDNVILSIGWEPSIYASWTEGLAQLVFGSALQGFFLRGAVTTGLLHHSEAGVFGPALNRAYELEQKLAFGPRVILDPERPELIREDLPWVRRAGDAAMIDPYVTGFIDRIRRRPVDAGPYLETYQELTGVAVGTTLVDIPAAALMGSILERLSAELRRPLPARAQQQLSWLFDHVAQATGVEARAADLGLPEPLAN